MIDVWDKIHINCAFVVNIFEFFDEKGEKAFCDYFWPNNGTKIIDRGLENFINVNSGNNLYDSFKYKYAEMAKDLVIVHWKILEPEIKVIDAKYSINDKIANFGGNFGIFAEITGCSFLGMVNFLILLFKLIFSPRGKNQGWTFDPIQVLIIV